MLGILSILLFAVTLIACIFYQLSIIYALVLGSLIFLAYGIIEGYSFSELWKMILSGVLTVKNILIVFLLI